jgi:hypothetical protein
MNGIMENVAFYVWFLSHYIFLKFAHVETHIRIPSLLKAE